MKLVKTLLLTTVAVASLNASAKSPFEGTFVGAQLGTSKAASVKKPSLVATAPGATLNLLSNEKASSKFGVNGGVLVGHRMAVAQDVILGVSLDVGVESTKTKVSGDVAGQDKSKADIKRKYIVNLLGQAGYTVTKDVLAFVTAGGSFTQFKIDDQKKNKFGFVVGAGVAYAINETVSADLTYLYTSYGKTKTSETDTTTVPGATITGNLYAPKAYHTVTVGVKVNI